MLQKPSDSIDSTLKSFFSFNDAITCTLWKRSEKLGQMTIVQHSLCALCLGDCCLDCETADMRRYVGFEPSFDFQGRYITADMDRQLHVVDCSPFE
jgi:hypothetical protein